MSKINAIQRSKIVSAIAWLYLVGAIIVLVSIPFGLNDVMFNDRFGLPDVPESVIKLVVGLLFLPLSYLYLKRARVGFWLMLIYTVVFGFISASALSANGPRLYAGNMLFSIFVFVYTLIRRREFTESITYILRRY